MTMQIIKTEDQYIQAMAHLDEIMAKDLKEGSNKANVLEVLAVLIEKYESETVDLGQIDPIEAIKLRMDQEGKTNKDLIPLLGSASKVSEVLNGKRPLSLKMIRALNKNMGISYQALMTEPHPTIEMDIDWNVFPLKEMRDRDLCPAYKSLPDVKEHAQECVEAFFGERLPMVQAMAFHRSSARSGRSMNQYALAVWHALSLQEAQKITPKGRFSLEALDDELFEELVALSTFDAGPLLAEEFLSRKGIRVVHVPHFSKTYLDGAALMLEKDNNGPVISLTGRHDRLDNYWYVLLHELAHIRHHMYQRSEPVTAIFDDLDVDAVDQIEEEADHVAMTTLVNLALRDELCGARDAGQVMEMADRNNRSPAIFAGYIRRESRNYRIFNNLIGRNAVNALFSSRP